MPNKVYIALRKKKFDYLGYCHYSIIYTHKLSNIRLGADLGAEKLRKNSS